MSARGAVDVLLVSLGSTEGLRTADRQFADAIQRAGASVVLAGARDPGPARTMMLTDLLWARAARKAAREALAFAEPRAVIYSTMTASLLWPRPGAIRFDATSAGNRPGRHGLWQRPLEARRLRAAPLLLPLSGGAIVEAPHLARLGERTIVLPIPVAASGPMPEHRDIAAITYAGDPVKKGLATVLQAWRSLRADASRPPVEELLIAGADADVLKRMGLIDEGERGVRVLPALAQSEYRALLRRSRVFVTAPRREDYGTAQLEALADGCMLVTSESPGPYAALPIARTLDRRLVGGDLERSLRTALDDPLAGYHRRALLELAPYAPDQVDARIAAELLPRLLEQ